MSRSVIRGLLLVIFLTSPLWADTKLVKLSRSDLLGAPVGSGEATEEQQVIVFGAERLRVDTPGISIIVRADKKRLYLIDHGRKTTSVLDLPIDQEALLPPEIDAPTRQAMRFSVDLEPSDEKASFGPWRARRYALTLSSAMARVQSTLWVSTEVELDAATFHGLYTPVILLQPGTAELAAALAALDGVEVARETVMQAGSERLLTREELLSVESMDPPQGFYEPPAEYRVTAFDLGEFLRSLG